MAKALSVDLRHRVVAAIAEGMSRRQAAARFGVSAASAVRWHQRFKASGTVAPSRQGGDRRSGRIEAYSEVILGLVCRCWVPLQPLHLASCSPFEAPRHLGMAWRWTINPV